MAYVPDAGERVPLVVFSHELGRDHTSGIRYAERLAEAGYATYVFDFCGGTVGGNRSNGDNVGMSVMTEASDLMAVLAEAATWGFVDPGRIFCLGGSQGAVVTLVVGAKNQDRVAAMMLMYPPLTLADDIRERFSMPDGVPEEFNMFGGWIRVGRNYATDVWDLHPYEEMAGYEGDVLLLHGDADEIVDVTVSERASRTFQQCEFHVVAGGAHGFFGPQFEDAIARILDFLGRHCDR